MKGKKYSKIGKKKGRPAYRTPARIKSASRFRPHHQHPYKLEFVRVLWG